MIIWMHNISTNFKDASYFSPQSFYVHFHNLYLILLIFVFSKSWLENITLGVLFWSAEDKMKIFVMKIKVHINRHGVAPGGGKPHWWCRGMCTIMGLLQKEASPIGEDVTVEEIKTLMEIIPDTLFWWG